MRVMFGAIRDSLAALLFTKVPSLYDSADAYERPFRQLLVDVSVIHRHDARTGIQRVVRSVLLQLLTKPIRGFEVRPVFATRENAYCYARPDFLGRQSELEFPGDSTKHEFVRVLPGDIFLGLDLSLIHI